MTACGQGVVLLLAFASALAGQDLSPEKVVAAIRKSEAHLRNLRVEGTYQRERRRPEGKWEYDGEVHFVARFSTRAPGLMRFDIEKEVTPWEHGAAPFSTESYATGFDGKEGRTLRRLVGERHPKRRPANMGWACWFSGWKWSLHGAGEWGKRTQQSRPFSVHLAQKWRSANIVIPGRPQMQAGVRVLEKETKGKVTLLVEFVGVTGNRVESWRLDPSRGHSVMEYRVHTRGVERTKVTIDALAAPAPGVFYPRRMTVVQRDRKTGKPTHRGTFVAKKIVANDPDLEPADFTIEWPPGTRVWTR